MDRLKRLDDGSVGSGVLQRVTRCSCPRFWRPEAPAHQYLRGAGPWKPLLLQAPGRLSETAWSCVGSPVESGDGAAEGNPDLDPKEEPRGCARVRVRVYGCGCFLIFFFFSQQVLFTYSIETRM